MNRIPFKLTTYLKRK